MRPISKIACLSLFTALAACGPNDGYYDSRGNYHAEKVDAPRHEDNYYVDHAAVRGDSAKVAGYDHNLDPDHAPDQSIVIYKRAGYYDSNGTFVPASSSPNIPRSYFPSRGLCRIWFMDRDVTDQPPIESCVGIQDRVPVGAFVVYGG